MKLDTYSRLFQHGYQTYLRSLWDQRDHTTGRNFVFDMSYREELRPRFGFTILSNGEVLRGDPRTFTEDMVAHSYARWMVMKSMGCFERDPEVTPTPEMVEMSEETNTKDMNVDVDNTSKADGAGAAAASTSTTPKDKKNKKSKKGAKK